MQFLSHDDYQVFPIGIATLVGGPLMLVAAGLLFARLRRTLEGIWVRRVVWIIGVLTVAAMFFFGAAEALIVALNPVTLLVMLAVAVYGLGTAGIVAVLSFALTLFTKGPASERGV